MHNEKVAWLEGVKITYQHMQLNEEIMFDRILSLFRNILHLNKFVNELSYKVSKDALTITRAVVIGKNNTLSVIDEDVTIDFSDVEYGIYDININTKDIGELNGAPGYKNDSSGSLVSVREKIDRYDKLRKKDILMIKPRLNCYLTLVMGEEIFFEEDDSVPALRVEWINNELIIKEELYSYNTLSKLFLDTLNSLSCETAAQVEKLVKEKIYNSYTEIYKDLCVNKLISKASIERGYSVKHGQNIVLNILKDIDDIEHKSKNQIRENRIFRKDLNEVWFCEEKINYGYIGCELKTNVSDIKEIEKLILIQDYKNIITCYQSGSSGVQIEIKNFKKIHDFVMLHISIDWSQLDTVALKALFDMEITRVWITS